MQVPKLECDKDYTCPTCGSHNTLRIIAKKTDKPTWCCENDHTFTEDDLKDQKG